MTLWLMGQYLRRPSVWSVSLVGAMLIVLWPIAAVSTASAIVVIQLRFLPGRASVFDAALPIAARDIVAARLFTRLLLMAIPTIACVFAWRGSLAAVWPLPRVLEIVSIFALALLLPFCVRPSVLNLPPHRTFVLPFVLLAAVSGLILWLAPSVAGAVILGTAVVALVAFTVASMPGSFERVAYGDSVHGASVAPAPRIGWLSDGAISAWRPILQSVTPWPVFLSFCFMVSGGWIGDWLLYLVIFSVNAHLMLRQRTAWLYALPLSHRARLLALAIPFCLSSFGGLTIGRALPSIGGLERDMAAEAPRSPYEKDKYFSSPTRVPLTYWKRFPARPLPPGATHIGRQVEVMSPWGESAVADTFSILGVMYFDPYTTGPHSSTRFVEWQFGNATTAVYGRSISRRDYEDETIPRPPRLVDTWSVQLLGGGLTVASLLYLLLVFELPLSARASRFKPSRVTMVTLLLLFLPVYAIGGVCMYNGWRRGGSIALPMIERALLAATRALPDNALVIAVIAAIPPIIMYVLLDRQFTRSEFPRVSPPRG